MPEGLLRRGKTGPAYYNLPKNIKILLTIYYYSPPLLYRRRRHSTYIGIDT